MDWAAVAYDVFGGLLIAGAHAACVPASFWQSFFLEHHASSLKLANTLEARAAQNAQQCANQRAPSSSRQLEFRRSPWRCLIALCQGNREALGFLA
jgi:hypothetical protein